MDKVDLLVMMKTLQDSKILFESKKDKLSFIDVQNIDWCFGYFKRKWNSDFVKLIKTEITTLQEYSDNSQDLIYEDYKNYKETIEKYIDSFDEDLPF